MKKALDSAIEQHEKQVMQFEQERKTITQMADKIEEQYTKEVESLTGRIQAHELKISELSHTLEIQEQAKIKAEEEVIESSSNA